MEVSPYRLRDLREDKGWSQADLAFASSLSRSFISQIESGARGVSPANAKCLAEALGVDLGELKATKTTSGVCQSCGSVVAYNH